VPQPDSVERWGVVADDVTGACDVAAEVRELGLEVAVMLGVPATTDVPADADVVVVGIGTRTAPRDIAVTESLAAASALRAAGVSRLYQKYCSTFDSTDEGMIGPVADALVAAEGLRASAGTPATPHADRTVYRGHLFVGDRLLSESPLAHHPLTPMTDPDLVRVLQRQTPAPVRLVDLRAVHAGGDTLARAVRQDAGHLLFDALDDDDLDAIAGALDDGLLPGGGAGLITALARRIAGRRPARATTPAPEGAELVLAGSASDRTRGQLAAAGGATVVIDAMLAGHDAGAAVGDALREVRQQLAARRRPIVSAGHDPQAIARAQREHGVDGAAAAVEAVLAGVALAAVGELGVRRMIVAGGETSGAVTRALGIRGLRLTRRVDPGVAWATGAATALADSPALAVLLKSGNFGGDDLFTRAWEQL
jgi:3-dehydrotetronate 4-kinase